MNHGQAIPDDFYEKRIELRKDRFHFTSRNRKPEVESIRENYQTELLVSKEAEILTSQMQKY
jgi:hypothetical protein